MSQPPRSERPIVAVLAVVIREGAVLLVRRANPPDAGLWGFPGGKLEFGETLQQASERELLEETGVRATAQEVIGAVDAWDRDADDRLKRHFVLVALRCVWQAGEPVAGDDATDARWVALEGLERALPLSHDVARMAHLALGKAPE